MNRREFAARLGLAGAATSLLPTLAHAQGAPAEGRDYVRLQTPAPTSASGKVEVVEFFGYWCPHCNAFEPSLDAWARKLPAHVAFKRIPVAFQAAQEIHQRLYFTLEAMGQVDAMHRKVFGAMHVQKMRLDKEADIVALVTANGVDGAKFADTFKSFTVQTKVRQARQLAEAYKIDGVPTIGIQGRFFTSPSLTGGAERALAVADFLIERSRGG